MKIELRNIKYAAFASQETSCFQASLYLDGIKAGTVENDGHGGCDNVHIHPQSLADKLDAYLATLPAVASEYLKDEDDDTKPRMMPVTLEDITGELLTTHLIERDVKRLTANKIVFTKVGKKGIYTSVKLKPEAKARAMAGLLSNTITIASMFKDADKCLNVLPMNEAVAIFRANGS